MSSARAATRVVWPTRRPNLLKVKVYALPAEESWICDQLVEDWKTYSGMSCDRAVDADVVWLLSDWRWRSLDWHVLSGKKVVTTVHHIVPEKFDRAARMDFAARDSLTTLYHVYNQRTLDFIRPLTKKPIQLVPYWANQNLWKRSELNQRELREKHGLHETMTIVGSFQRDTEGHDLKSPKLEKGPDLFVEYLIEKKRVGWSTLHVLLAGWRRQYVVGRLKEAGISYTYVERPSQDKLCELYQTLDLYAVTARHEGGPQALIECGLLGVPVISTPVGIAEQVLPSSAINTNVTMAVPTIPNVESMKLPNGMDGYRRMFESLR